MKIVKTPLRISLFGGGTDFPEYFKNNKSLIIGSSINKFIFTSFNINTKLSEKKIKIFYKKNQFTDSINNISHPVIKQVLKNYHNNNNNQNFEMHLAADLPSSAGLGSSSAFATGLINLFNHLNNKKKGKKELALEIINFERKVLKEFVGYQDQIHSVFGGFNFIEFYKDDFRIKPYKNYKLLDKLNKNLFLVFSNMTRKASEIEKKKIKRIKVNERFYKQISDISYEAKNIFNEKYHIDEIGSLLDKTWDLKKKLSNSVSNNRLDQLYNFAKKNGASGGKILGAGAGGFFVFYVPKKNHDIFKKKISRRFRVIEFKFSYKGSEVIEI